MKEKIHTFDEMFITKIKIDKSTNKKTLFQFFLYYLICICMHEIIFVHYEKRFIPTF